VSFLPQIESKESRMTDIVTAFQSKEAMIHSIKNASEKIQHTSLGAVSHFSTIIDDIIDAFGSHYKLVNEQLSPETKAAALKNVNPLAKHRKDSKNQGVSHDESGVSMSRSSSNKDFVKLPIVRSPSKMSGFNDSKFLQDSGEFTVFSYILFD